MKRIAIALGVVLLVFGAAVLARTQTASVEQELIKLEHDWAEATLKNDIAFFERILADDYTETDEEGNVITKAQAIALMKSDESVVTSEVQDDIKVRVYGDAAVVIGRSTFKGQYKGKDWTAQYQWTDTWIKRDGRWQCVANHASLIPQK